MMMINDDDDDDDGDDIPSLKVTNIAPERLGLEFPLDRLPDRCYVSFSEGSDVGEDETRFPLNKPFLHRGCLYRSRLVEKN